MKRFITLILCSIVFSVSATSLKHQHRQSIDKNFKQTLLKKKQSETAKHDQFTEIKYVQTGGILTCYTRECRTFERDNGDGTSVEVKVCTPWQVVPCPEEPAPDPTNPTNPIT